MFALDRQRRGLRTGGTVTVTVTVIRPAPAAISSSSAPRVHFSLFKRILLFVIAEGQPTGVFCIPSSFPNDAFELRHKSSTSRLAPSTPAAVLYGIRASPAPAACPPSPGTVRGVSISPAKRRAQ